MLYIHHSFIGDHYVPRSSFPTELRMPTVASVAAGSLVTLSLTPAAVATIVAAKQTFTVAGLNAGDSVVPLSNPNTQQPRCVVRKSPPPTRCA